MGGPAWRGDAFFGAACGAVYAGGAVAGHAMSLQSAYAGSFGLFWPPDGILLAFLLCAPPRRWAACLAGAAAANIVYNLGVDRPPAVALAYASGDALQAWIAAALVRRFGSSPAVFDTLRDTLLFILGAQLIGPALSATLGAITMTLAGAGPPAPAVWALWWSADAVSAVMIPPLAVSALHARRAGWPAPRRALEAAALVAAVAPWSWIVLTGSGPLARPFAAMPLLLVCGVRYGPCAAASANFAAALAVIALGFSGAGHFVIEAASREEEVAGAHAAILVMSLTSIMVAVVVRERDRTLERLREAQRTIAHSEERHRVLIDALPDVILLHDRGGRIRFASHAVERYTGTPPAAILGKTLRELGAGENFARLAEEQLEQVFARAAPFEQTVDCRTRRGATRFDLRLLPLPDGETALALARDVTDLHRREQDYQTIFREMLDGFAVHEMIYDAAGEPADYRFLAVNPAFERLTGLAADRVTGRTVREVLPDIEPAWIARYGRVADTGEPDHFESYAAAMGRHYRVTAYRPQPGHFACIFEDVTERRRAEEALRASESKARAILDAAPFAIALLSPDAAVIDCNRTFAEMLGCTREDLAGACLYDRLPPGLTERARSIVAEALATRRPQRGMDRLGEAMYEHGCNPLGGPDAPPHALLAHAHDITDRLRMQEELARLEAQYHQAQRLEAVGQLAGGVAHDFNNLLQVILGYTELARHQAPAGSPAAAHLANVAEAGVRAKDLVGQLLAFSRRQVLEPADLDLNAVIAEFSRMLGRVIGEHIRLHVVPGHRLGAVCADRGMLEQVLMNLCVNARDAMAAGGDLTIETENVTIDDDYCRVHAWARPGRFVLMCVTDTGAGIPPDHLERVFEPFFTTKEEGRGTGLGLATVYGIVKQHGGMITVYSELDKGTTFKVYLPIVARRAADVGSKVAGRAPGGSETILLAEDDPMVRGLAKDLLERAGYRVIAAEDGEEAVLRFKQHRGEIALALLDVMMPRMGGRAAYERMRELRPSLPALFASGYSENAVHTNFVLDAGLALIKKPYELDELLRRVREAIDGARPAV